MIYRIHVFKTLVFSVLICFTSLALYLAFQRQLKNLHAKLHPQQQQEDEMAKGNTHYCNSVKTVNVQGIPYIVNSNGFALPHPLIKQNYSSKSIDFDLFNHSKNLQHVYVFNKRYPSSEGQRFECIRTRTIPTFNICVFSAKDDLHISGSLQRTGTWDMEQTVLIKKALNTFPNALFIDVGANIGYFSLLARAMGRTVIAIEPTDEAFLRLQEGVIRNKFFDNILMLKYAISDKWTRVVMGENELNKGGIAVTREVNNTANISRSVEAISMDDIVNLITAKEIVIKMDIEGYECKALQSSSVLLQKFKVRYIFMEWLVMPRDKDKTDTPCSKANIMHMLANMYSKGFKPYSLESRELDVDDSASWSVYDIYWKPADSPCL